VDTSYPAPFPELNNLIVERPASLQPDLYDQTTNGQAFSWSELPGRNCCFVWIVRAFTLATPGTIKVQQGTDSAGWSDIAGAVSPSFAEGANTSGVIFFTPTENSVRVVLVIPADSEVNSSATLGYF